MIASDAPTGHGPAMTSDSLATIGALLYGPEFTGPLAAALGVRRDTVAHWRGGRSQIPAGVATEIAAAALDTAARLEAEALSLIAADALEAFGGERPVVAHRRAMIVARLRIDGHIRRETIRDMTGVSMSQATIDLGEIERALPALMSYDTSAKRYVLAPVD